MSKEGLDVKDFKTKLLNYLINYLVRNRNRNRYNLTFRIDPEVYEDFKFVCHKLGLLRGTSRGNLVVEAFMQWFTENFDSPKIFQATLFYKPQIKVEQKTAINIAQKLELKLTLQSLTAVLNRLEQRQGDAGFLMQRLRELLPKAIRLYEKTEDKTLGELLQKTEKWIR